MALKISVVTVCFNAGKELETTILSVINQTYENVEYIIIDGASKDNSVDIIEKYSDCIDYWISEPDKGIYDAMNKGIVSAQGDYIIFMNAGDLFYGDDTIEKCVRYFNKNEDVYYGNTLCRYKYFDAEMAPKPIESIEEMLPFCHQSSFVRTDYHKENLFKLSYRIFADYNFFYTLYHKGGNFKYINELVSIFDAEEGISSKFSSKKIREHLVVKGAYSRTNFLKIMLMSKLINFAVSLKRKILPTRYYWGNVLYSFMSNPYVISLKNTHKL